MTSTSAVEVVRKIETESKAKANASPVRYGTLAPGDYHRQGDIYIQRIEKLPKSAKTSTVHLQLVPGETQGSRHCLDSLDGVTMYTKPDATPLDGPLLRTTQERTITHPEHGHVTIPAGIYAITYQRQYANELRRVAD